MIQSSEQRPRCDCCGEFLGPEHVPVRRQLYLLGKLVLDLQAFVTDLLGRGGRAGSIEGKT